MAGKEILKGEETQVQVEDTEFTEEESKNQMRLYEEDIIQGLIAAAGFRSDEVKEIEIARNGKIFFKFHIRPLTEEDYDKCKKKNTKYVRNKQLGVRMPEETNSVKYRAALIYAATTEEDREKLWDSKKVWAALRNQGLQIMNGLDVIEYTLMAGEKDRVIEEIDRLSGYESNLEEVAKN